MLFYGYLPDIQNVIHFLYLSGSTAEHKWLEATELHWKLLIIPADYGVEFRHQNVSQLKQGCQTLQFLLLLHVTLSIITLIMNLASGFLISQRKWHIHQNKITAFMNDQSSISLTWLIMLYLYSFLTVEPISFAVISL